MLSAHPISTGLTDLIQQQNYTTARQTLKKIITTAMGFGFLSEEFESKSEITDDASLIEKLKIILKNTDTVKTPFELIFNAALSKINFSDDIIAISLELQADLDTLFILEAERLTSINITNFLKLVAAPAKLLDEKYLAELTNKEQIILALKNVKLASEAKDANVVTTLIYEALSKVDLNAPNALHIANIRLQPCSPKCIHDLIALHAIHATIKNYKTHVKKNLILWNSLEVNTYSQIEDILEKNKNLSATKKLTAINNKIRPAIKKEFLDENDVIDQEKLESKTTPLSVKKILAAIYFSLEKIPAFAIQEKIDAILSPTPQPTYLPTFDLISPKTW